LIILNNVFGDGVLRIIVQNGLMTPVAKVSVLPKLYSGRKNPTAGLFVSIAFEKIIWKETPAMFQKYIATRPMPFYMFHPFLELILPNIKKSFVSRFKFHYDSKTLINSFSTVWSYK
jgi:hypothetical protein